jgi:hypothetical protein
MFPITNWLHLTKKVGLQACHRLALAYLSLNTAQLSPIAFSDWLRTKGDFHQSGHSIKPSFRNSPMSRQSLARYAELLRLRSQVLLSVLAVQ